MNSFDDNLVTRIRVTGEKTKLQKKVWYGWKTISWCYTSLLFESYGFDKDKIVEWLWWSYRTKGGSIDYAFQRLFNAKKF